jgi:hypothetical protein
MICMPRERKNSSHAASIQRFVTIVFPLPPRLGRFLWFGAGETLSVGRLATFAGRSTWLLRSSGKLVGKDSSFDSMESTGLQFFRNQIFIARVSTGDEQQCALILLNHAFFLGSSALQPLSENSTIDPSLCFHLNVKLIVNEFPSYVCDYIEID